MFCCWNCPCVHQSGHIYASYADTCRFILRCHTASYQSSDFFGSFMTACPTVEEVCFELINVRWWVGGHIVSSYIVFWRGHFSKIVVSVLDWLCYWICHDGSVATMFCCRVQGCGFDSQQPQQRFYVAVGAEHKNTHVRTFRCTIRNPEQNTKCTQDRHCVLLFCAQCSVLFVAKTCLPSSLSHLKESGLVDINLVCPLPPQTHTHFIVPHSMCVALAH